MACGCKKRAVGPAARVSNDSNVALMYDENNFLVLAANPDDCEAYTGFARTATIFVVGYGTPHERVFHQGDSTAAQSWAQQYSLTIRKASGANLCKQVMLAVLAHDYPSVAA